MLINTCKLWDFAIFDPCVFIYVFMFLSLNSIKLFTVVGLVEYLGFIIVLSE